MIKLILGLAVSGFYLSMPFCALLMKRSLLILLLSLGSFAEASTDSLAPATFLHTKVELPEPYRVGEVIAEFIHQREEGMLRFRSLTIKVASQTIEIPKQILDFFAGPQPATIQFLVGPAMEANRKTPDYFHVQFRYLSYAEDGRASPNEYPTGSIYIKNGALQGIARWEKRPDGGPKVQFYDINLKPVQSLE